MSRKKKTWKRQAEFYLRESIEVCVWVAAVKTDTTHPLCFTQCCEYFSTGTPHFYFSVRDLITVMIVIMRFFCIRSTLPGFLGSWWGTDYTWHSSVRFPRSRLAPMLRKTPWPSSKSVRSATSTSSSRSRSCRASCSWDTAWRSSGGPTEVSLLERKKGTDWCYVSLGRAPKILQLSYTLTICHVNITCSTWLNNYRNEPVFLIKQMASV